MTELGPEFINGGGHLVSLQDRSLRCCDCGIAFTFSAEEQELFQSKGYVNEPKRCPLCRQARQERQGKRGDGPRRQMFPAKCADCGKDTEVPFEPRGDRPVYCNDLLQQARQRLQ